MSSSVSAVRLQALSLLTTMMPGRADGLLRQSSTGEQEVHMGDICMEPCMVYGYK